MSHNVTIALFELRNENPVTCIQDERVPSALLSSNETIIHAIIHTIEKVGFRRVDIVKLM